MKQLKKKMKFLLNFLEIKKIQESEGKKRKKFSFIKHCHPILLNKKIQKKETKKNSLNTTNLTFNFALFRSRICFGILYFDLY